MRTRGTCEWQHWKFFLGELKHVLECTSAYKDARKGNGFQMRDGRKRLGHSEEAVGNGPTSLLRRPEGTGDYSLFLKC